MIVVNTPSKEFALSNFAYYSTGDLRMFATPGASSALVLVGDSVVPSLIKHSNIPDGQIALNAIQRRHTKVSAGDQISVITFFPPSGFSLELLSLELHNIEAKANVEIREDLDAVCLAQHLREKFVSQVMTVGQRVLFEFLGNNYILTVNQALAEDQENSNAIKRGIITDDTYIVFEAVSSSGIKIFNQREAASSSIFRRKEFNLQELGIGGLSEEFAKIFRRVFASRVYLPHVIKKLGIRHVKGILLFAPPGTGKKLLARQLENCSMEGNQRLLTDLKY